MESRSHVSYWLATLLRPTHWLFMRLYFRVEVLHAERIPEKGPVILVPTHRSRWDMFALYCATTKRVLRIMASHDEFIGGQGWFMRHLGAFPVDTEKPSPSVLRHCRELIEARHALVIFPEATIYYYPPNQIHPLKSGAAWLALDSQRRSPDVPLKIVPIRLIYSDRYLKFRSRITVDVREPICLTSYLDKPGKEAIRLLTADMQSELGDEVNESIAERSTPRPRPNQVAAQEVGSE
jgi:1-acyl-sn-glycerol-3-phosphate acyltransferase